MGHEDGAVTDAMRRELADGARRALDLLRGHREGSKGMESNGIGIVSDARGRVEVGGDLTDTDAVFLAWMVKNVVNDMDGRWDVRIEVRGGYGDE